MNMKMQEIPDEFIGHLRHGVTKGSLRMRSWFFDVIKKREFQKRIAHLRVHFGIPLQGFEDVTKDEGRQWFRNTLKEKKTELVLELTKLRTEYGFYSPEYSDSFFLYLTENTALEIGAVDFNWDMCDLSDRKKPKPYQESDDHKDAFPIAIYVNPYATENEIIDYLKTVYPTIIKPLQEHHGDKELAKKIGRVKGYRNELVRKRNDLIYDNRHLSREALSAILKQEIDQDLPDEGSVAKIISLEKKKRD